MQQQKTVDEYEVSESTHTETFSFKQIRFIPNYNYKDVNRIRITVPEGTTTLQVQRDDLDYSDGVLTVK